MILEIDGISFDYRSKPVLQDIRFNVKCNELVAVLGPNGVGKTTLLKCINTILKPQNGTILVKNENILNLGRMDIAKRIGYVAQRCESCRLTAFDAILLGRRPHIRWNVSKQDLKIVDAAIRRLDLEDLALRYIDEMSGGELQKVSIARALVQDPTVLLLDEPTSSLDLKNQLEILKIIRQTVKHHPISAVMTLHDLNTALRYSDKYVFMKDGRIFAAGGKEIVTPEIIETVYGVPVAVKRFNGHPLMVPLN